MLPTIAVTKGDRIRAIGGVGGGYGKAMERPAAELVLEDVLDGYLTREARGAGFPGRRSPGDGKARRDRDD